MRILIVLSRVPYPLEKGDKLRAYHQLRILSQRHKIVLCCLSDEAVDPKAEAELSVFCESIHIVRMSKLSIGFRMLGALFSALPYQVHYFRDRRMKSLIEGLVSKGDIDHIYCQLIRCAEMVKDIKSTPKTIDYMDALSLGMGRRVDGASALHGPFIRSEKKRLLSYEKAVHPFFDTHTIISEVDRDALEVADKKNIAIVRNGVGLSYFSPNAASKKEFDLLFVGNLSYKPNIDCVAYLVQEVMPIVWKSQPEATLHIAGANPSAEVQQHAKTKNVTLSGWVEDIRDAYASARVFTAPMRIGSGLQNKLLESLAMQVPAITSSLANLALGAAEGKEILIGDTPSEVAKHCLWLLTNTDESRSQAIAGRQLVERSFSWRGSVDDLEKVMLSAHE